MTEANFHESLLCDIVNINICARNGYEAVGNDNESLNDSLQVLRVLIHSTSWNDKSQVRFILISHLFLFFFS